MAHRLLPRFLAASLVFALAGCSGGGCGALAPIPGGFPLEHRTENGASVRVTKAGLTFLGQTVGALVSASSGDGPVFVGVPESTSQISVLGVGVCDMIVCPGGPDVNANPPRCFVELDMKSAELALESAPPDRLLLHGDSNAPGAGLPLRIQHLPVAYSCAGGLLEGEITVVANGDEPPACPGEPQLFAPIDLTAEMSVGVQSGPGASGYSQITIEQIALDEPSVEQALDLGCGGGADDAIAQAAKGLLVGLLLGPTEAILQDQIASALALKPNPDVDPPCPPGSAPSEACCMHPSGQCVTMPLGLEGRLPLSSLLSSAASTSPETDKRVDLLLLAGGQGQNPATGAPWGQLDPALGGATLGVYGGLLAQPKSACVEPVDVAPPSGVPIPDALFQNTTPGWPAGADGPHLGLAFSEAFLDNALTGVHNSGLLCLDVTAETLPDAALFLNTGALKLLIPAEGLSHLGLQDEPARVAITLRPGAPAHVEIGKGGESDPLLALSLPALSIDLYAFSLDRYVRFLTLTYDVAIGLDLVSGPDGLTPALRTLALDNGEVSNLVWLRPGDVDADSIAAGLVPLLQEPLASALSGVKIDLAGMLSGLGLSVIVPQEGIGKLSQGDHDYLALFASFEAVPPQPGGGSCALAGAAPGGAPFDLQGTGAALWLGVLGMGLWLRRGRARARSIALVSLLAAALAGTGCQCGSTRETVTTTTGLCTTCEELTPGLVGAYTSAVSIGSTLWVAGYLEKTLTPEDNLYSWGDLVVGRYEGSSVTWEIVDGLPAEEKVDPSRHDPTGFRGGKIEPGDDVGTFTSIASGPEGAPVIAYHDRTHGSLKLARRAGEEWLVHTVDSPSGGEAGRYAKLLSSKGLLQIAYLFVEPGKDGTLRSGVRLAKTTSAEPEAGDWAFEEVVSNPATPPMNKPGAYPAVTGSHIAIALAPGETRPVIVYRDGVRGNLLSAERKDPDPAWSIALLDGEEAGADTGDVGLGASLFVTGNTWHIAYGSASDKSLRYLRVEGETALPPEVVDIGTRTAPETFVGRHAVGADTSIFVAQDGVVHIAYQDATGGTLRRASGKQGASWAITALAQPGFGGFFPTLLPHDGALRVVSFTRDRGASLTGDVTVLAP